MAEKERFFRVRTQILCCHSSRNAVTCAASDAGFAISRSGNGRLRPEVARVGAGRHVCGCHAQRCSHQQERFERRVLTLYFRLIFNVITGATLNTLANANLDEVTEQSNLFDEEHVRAQHLFMYRNLSS